MTSAEWHSTLFQFIGLILSLITFIGSIIAIWFTYLNLKEMRKQLKEQQNQYFEQNRGNILFYIRKSDVSVTHDLIIKNFGNSPAKLLSLEISPDLDWSKAGNADIKQFNVSNLKNIFLAPQQHIGTIFDFSNYDDEKFDIKLSYETCGKLIKEEYSIDINCLHNVLTLDPEIKDVLSALKYINRSITALSNKFI